MSFFCSIFENKDTLLERRDELSRRRALEYEDLELSFLTPSRDNLRSDRGHRQLDQKSCDVAFFDCIPNNVCVDCFTDLELNSIDWAGVTPDTSCEDVVRFLNNKGHCPELSNNAEGKEAFCNTFRGCVVWKGFGENDDMVPDEDDEGYVNCTALTECKWPGMHENWIGDGVCHDNLHGCYNTKICNWDGGDCCEDTCKKNHDGDFVDCGHDGYACRDPNSAQCDPTQTKFCPSKGKDDDVVECGPGEQMYRLIMYDSFGDGWDTTKVTIKLQGTSKAVFSGALEDGSYGEEKICLSKEPACYTAETGGGVWGIESSWEIKPAREGAASKFSVLCSLFDIMCFDF